MEKKKLLMVAVSLGVVLVIVVSAAILFFKPGSGFVSAASNYSGFSQTTTENSRTVMEPVEAPREIPPVPENHIDIYNNSGLTVDNKGDAVSAQTVINIPKPTTAAVPDVQPAVKPVVKKAEPRPAPAKPAPAPKKTYKDYWVQAGSYSTRDRADGVKNTLSSKGLSAIVSNQEINGNTYYRVRIGPYTSQNEADYWLAMVKSIDGFQDSLIWESQSFR